MRAHWNIVTSAKTFTDFYIKENVSTEPRLILNEELVLASKKKYGIELLDKNSLDFWNSIFETRLIGGLISHEDGRLNPIKLIKSLMESLDQIKINKINKTVSRINRNSNLYDKNWNIYLENINECQNWLCVTRNYCTTGMCGKKSLYKWNNLNSAPCICDCNTKAKIIISVSQRLNIYPSGIKKPSTIR